MKLHVVLCKHTQSMQLMPDLAAVMQLHCSQQLACYITWPSCMQAADLQCLPCAMQIHAEGEAEHAAIGHDAVLSFVPAEHEQTLRRAMHDHDRDFSAFYNKLADMLQ